MSRFLYLGTGAFSRVRKYASSQLTAELFRGVLSHGRPFKTSGTGSGGTAWIFYFAGQAGWNYLCVPFIFDDPSYELEFDGTWRDGSETWRRLKVTFPPHIYTHCRQQIFYADRDGMIRRMDYTAEPFGERAKAAHYEYDHRQFSGFVVLG